MHRHTSNICRRNVYVSFNAFINIKTAFLYKTMHHHTVQTLYKIFCKKHLIHVLSKHMNGPPDYNSVDYCFWNKVKEKLHENRLNKLLENDWELKKRIESGWKDIAFNLPEIRRAIKQFSGRLKAVKEREGECIKMIYG